MKLMAFLKVDAGFGLLVDSVQQCIIDCIPFTVFLVAWISLFGVLFRVLGMTIPVGDYGDHNILNPIAVYGI